MKSATNKIYVVNFIKRFFRKASEVIFGRATNTSANEAGGKCFQAHRG